MDVSTVNICERIARVLAGQRLSANAGGTGRSVSAQVDAEWPRHLAAAAAVLRTMREPDPAMAAVGDVAVWERMMLAAVAECRGE